MFNEYNLALKAFADEMLKEGISLEEIKHPDKRRIKKIAQDGLGTATNGELSHLFYCPHCMALWYRFWLSALNKKKKEE